MSIFLSFLCCVSCYFRCYGVYVSSVFACVLSILVLEYVFLVEVFVFDLDR